MQARLRLPAIAVLFALFTAAGCIFSPKDCTGPDCDEQEEYLPQTSPENVIHNVELSYKLRDIDKYCEQFAYDFFFFFDEQDLGDPGVPPDGTFTFLQDSVSTRNMFRNENLPSEEERVLDIRIRLQHGPSVPDNRAGKESWRYILVQNTFLEVDQQGSTETVTLQVNGGQADFYFRKGRTPEDTSSNLWYVVEWRDRPLAENGAPGLSLASARGVEAGSAAGSAARPVPTSRSLTLGALKALFR